MKKNLPKFLIADNDGAASGITYIIHTQDPSFIAEVKVFLDNEERIKYMSDHEELEIIVIDRIRIIEIKKYLESADRNKRRSYLETRLKYWVIANVINSNES